MARTVAVATTRVAIVSVWFVRRTYTTQFQFVLDKNLYYYFRMNLIAHYLMQIFKRNDIYVKTADGQILCDNYVSNNVWATFTQLFSPTDF